MGAAEPGVDVDLLGPVADREREPLRPAGADVLRPQRRASASPYVMTRARVRRRMSRTSGSSALSTATPAAAGSRSASFWTAMASAEP